MIDRISGRVALVLVVGAVALIVLLGWFVLVSPERAKAGKLDTQIGDTNTQLAQVTALLNGPVGRESLIANRLFEKAVPSDPKVSQILRQLSAAAVQTGVELDSITPSALVPGAGSETLPISLSVSGHYFALQAFLRILRNEAVVNNGQVRANGRLYTVDSISFTGGSSSAATASASGNVITASLALNAYVYSPTSAATAPAAVTPSATP
jgi:Tfp pilus assembly protein PilO